MPATGTTVNEEHTRFDTITIAGEADMECRRHAFSDDYVSWVPNEMSILYRRASDNDPWRVCSVHVYGPRRRKNGEIGKATGGAVWAADVFDKMPKWVADIVHHAIQIAHTDRVAYTSPRTEAAR